VIQNLSQLFGLLLAVNLSAIFGICGLAKHLTRAVARLVPHVAYAIAAMGAVMAAKGALPAIWALRWGPARPSAYAFGFAQAVLAEEWAFSAAFLAGTWVLVWLWIARRRRQFGLLLAPLLLAAIIVGFSTNWRARAEDRAFLAEPESVLAELRLAQERYHAGMGEYANVSTALAANQGTNHGALYPQAPREPGRYLERWGGTASPGVCSAPLSWEVLPMHVDGPVIFGYTTIAGRAGERPSAVVSINGRRVEWPVPQSDWFVASAVGDTRGDGIFKTVVVSSFRSGALVDNAGE
jgi:hypothetical protein